MHVECHDQFVSFQTSGALLPLLMHTHTHTLAVAKCPECLPCDDSASQGMYNKLSTSHQTGGDKRYQDDAVEANCHIMSFLFLSSHTVALELNDIIC